MYLRDAPDLGDAPGAGLELVELEEELRLFIVFLNAFVLRYQLLIGCFGVSW